MDRRTFLRGMVIGTSAVAAQATIQLATPEETALLAMNKPTELFQDTYEPRPTDVGLIVFLQREQGFIPFGVIQDIHHSVEPIDISDAQDTFARFMPGMRRTTATVLVSGIYGVRAYRTGHDALGPLRGRKGRNR